MDISMHVCRHPHITISAHKHERTHPYSNRSYWWYTEAHQNHFKHARKHYAYSHSQRHTRTSANTHTHTHRGDLGSKVIRLEGTRMRNETLVIHHAFDLPKAILPAACCAVSHWATHTLINSPNLTA